MPGNQFSSIEHIVVLILENRSFDRMLGLLYSTNGNGSLTGQLFESLTDREGIESRRAGVAVPVFPNRGYGCQCLLHTRIIFAPARQPGGCRDIEPLHPPPPGKRFLRLFSIAQPQLPPRCFGFSCFAFSLSHKCAWSLPKVRPLRLDRSRH